MIPKIINDWLEVIEKMKNDNTYKPCFGRALIECINNNEFVEQENNFIISFDKISINMIRYYWNQLFFFNLKQSANDRKPPVICQIVFNMIERYKQNKNNVIPVVFDLQDSYDVIDIIGKDYYLNCIKKVSKIIPENVLYRFLNCDNEIKKLYSFDLKKKIIIFDKFDLVLVKEYGIIISQLLNYKWAQLLEKYNTCPRIVNKVQSISINKIRRNNLSKYKEQLLKQFKDGKIIDFYTNEEISLDDVSIDHVIPWSFMYSDDIWNLVVTSKSNNSKKSNIIPSLEIIEKLKVRNNSLIDVVDSKYQFSLEEEKKLSLLDRYFFECRL